MIAGARVSDCSTCGNYFENYFPFDATKDDILNGMRGWEDEWQDVPLQNPNTSVAQAKKDFRRQKVVLNGVSFTPELNSMNNNDLFSNALYHMSGSLLQLCPLADVRAADIAESVMQYSCRSSTGADSFFAVHQLFSIQDTIVAQHENEDHATIEISLFSTRGAIYARSDCKNSYSLVDISQIGEETPIPWMFVNTYIRDEVNFKTGSHHRTLSILPSEQYFRCTSVRRPIQTACGEKRVCSMRSETDIDTDRDDCGRNTLS